MCVRVCAWPCVPCRALGVSGVTPAQRHALLAVDIPGGGLLVVLVCLQLLGVSQGRGRLEVLHAGGSCRELGIQIGLRGRAAAALHLDAEAKQHSRRPWWKVLWTLV